MHIRDGECITKIVKRHPTPFVLRMLGVLTFAVPLYIVLYMFNKNDADAEWIFITFVFVSVFIAVLVITLAVDYLLDKLIITNKRVIWVNWRSIVKKSESEVELRDIQDVDTKDKGLLSSIPIFNYGLMQIATASSDIAITFLDCPDHNAIKHLIMLEVEQCLAHE